MKKESNIQSAILVALSEAGCTVWRVETAGVWLGRPVHKDGATVTLANARMMLAGLCKGGSDIIGLAPCGKFLAVEVKAPKGRVRPDQQIFIDAVRKAGGIAGVARSPSEALELLSK